MECLQENNPRAVAEWHRPIIQLRLLKPVWCNSSVFCQICQKDGRRRDTGGEVVNTLNGIQRALNLEEESRSKKSPCVLCSWCWTKYLKHITFNMRRLAVAAATRSKTQTLAEKRQKQRQNEQDQNRPSDKKKNLRIKCHQDCWFFWHCRQHCVRVDADYADKRKVWINLTNALCPCVTGMDAPWANSPMLKVIVDSIIGSR